MEQIGDITECSICSEMFTDPRVLPCIHTFCLKCLEATTSKSGKKPGDTMPCPICRQEFPIPADGLSDLRKNFFMGRLMEIANISKPSETKVSCDICLINKDDADIEIPDASRYCVECRENMCEFCSVQHKRQKFSRNHQIVAFGSQLKDELAKKSTAIYCNQHRKDELKMYCTDCMRVICMTCFAEDHQMHSCADVNKVADGYRGEIDFFMAKIAEGLHNGMERKRKLLEKQRTFLEEIEYAEYSIRERTAVLKQLIETHPKVLLNELGQIRVARRKETESENKDIERHLQMLNSFSAYYSEIRSKGTDVDICRSVNDMRSRAKKLEEVNATKKKQDVTHVQVFFKSSRVEDMLETKNIVGSLDVQHNLSIVQHKSTRTLEMNKEQPVSVDFITMLQCSSLLQAVTKLDDKIYVLCIDESNFAITLYIFEDRHSFECCNKIRIREIEWYIDVASSDKFRFLYIWDSKNKCVWRLMADNLKVTKWLSNLDGLIALSTSNDGLLMLLRDDNGMKKLETYESDAKICRSISLSSDILHPIDFAQDDNGKFIIIQKLDDSENESLLLSELSNEGQILRQFQMHEELSDPIYLYFCLDSEKDRLFVAQRDDFKLVFLIFDLVSFEWKQSILIPEDPFNMGSLFYDASRKQLLVERTDNVAVYQFN